MPLMTGSADALPYLDQQPSAEAMAAAQSLIQADLSPDHETTLHPSIPAQRATQFPALLTAEHDHLASGAAPRSPGIDMSRYQSLDAPTDSSEVAAWKEVLQRAYIGTEYMRGREANLGLLEAYGKNAWLVGNSQLEDLLRDLDREVERAKLDLEQVEYARRTAQGRVAGEMAGLEESWQKGLARMLETQVAGEGLRQEILRRRRADAK